jgi:hypothetical protein
MSPTHLRWENMPGVITQPLEPEWASLSGSEIQGRLGKYYEKLSNTVFHAPGVMTGRDVMQFVGTELFRKMYGNVWVDATVRQIEADQPAIALVSDVRFPNEVCGLQAAGGIVVRLTRNDDNPDTHESETALNKDIFDWDTFNVILDNSKQTIPEQNQEVYSLMVSLGLVDKKE